MSKKLGKVKRGKTKARKVKTGIPKAVRARTVRRNRRRASRRRRSVSPLLLIIVLVISGIVGYVLMSNPDLRNSITQGIDSAWRTAYNFIFDSDDGPIIPVEGEIVVHFIDVGQGDSTLIQTTQGSVLIDGGDNHMGGRVADYLRRAGVTELAYIIATHPHADHIGGLIEVLDQFPVGTLIMPPVAHTTITFERFLEAIEDSGVPLQTPVAGSTFNVGDALFTIIAPNSTGHSNLNDYSVSLRITHGTTGFIFTGDAEAAAELEMIAAGHNLSADVLRVGHHGSSTSTTQEFLDAVNPSIAVVSAGAGNSYGHPHNTVMSRLRVAGVRIYRTDHHGNIAIVSNGANLTVHHD